MSDDSPNHDILFRAKARTRREACELYALAVGATVERRLESSDRGSLVLLLQGREIAVVNFGPALREYEAWREMGQVALALLQYERLRSR